MADILVPTEQEGTTAVVKTWLKKVGDAVRGQAHLARLDGTALAADLAALDHVPELEADVEAAIG